jgi:hypothetical protein
MKTIAQQLNVKEFPFEIKDSQGNQIYDEESNGFWWKREYDSHGNEIYCENSDGYWFKCEYNSNGDKIYVEYSTGYWYKQEYNSQGNLLYYENSKGEFIDKRPKSTCEGKTVEIDGITYKLMKA